MTIILHPCIYYPSGKLRVVQLIQQSPVTFGALQHDERVFYLTGLSMTGQNPAEKLCGTAVGVKKQPISINSSVRASTMKSGGSGL